MIPVILMCGCHGRHLGDLIHAFPKARFIVARGQFEIPLPPSCRRRAPWRCPTGTRVHHGHPRTRGFQEAFALQTISLSLPCNAQARDGSVVDEGDRRDPLRRPPGHPREPREGIPASPTKDSLFMLLHWFFLTSLKPRWCCRILGEHRWRTTRRASLGAQTQ